MFALGWLLFFLLSLVSVFTNALVAITIVLRRDKLGPQWPGLVVTHGLAVLWMLSILLSMVLPDTPALWARHISRLLLSWTVTAFATALLWVSTRWYRRMPWLGFLLGVIHLALWLSYTPPNFHQYRFIAIHTPWLDIQWITYRTHYLVLALNMLVLAMAGTTSLAYAHKLLTEPRRQLYLGTAFILALTLWIIAGSYVLKVIHPWDLIPGILWLPAWFTFRNLTRGGTFTPITIEQVVDNLGEGVLIFTETHRIVWSNRTARRLLGLEEDTTFTGRIPRIEVMLHRHPHIVEWVKKHSGHPPVGTVFTVETPQGRRFWWAWLVRPQREQQRRGKILYLIDETARREDMYQIEIRYQEMQWMARLMELVFQSRPLEITLKEVLRVFLQPLGAFQAKAAALYVYDANEPGFRLAAVLGRARTDLREGIPLQSVLGFQDAPWPGDFCRLVPQSAQPAWLFPLRVGEEWQGLLWLEASSRTQLQAEEREVLLHSTTLLAHLLQATAVSEYRERLSRIFFRVPEGVLLFHISTGYPELVPHAARALAETLDIDQEKLPRVFLEPLGNWEEVVSRLQVGEILETLHEARTAKGVRIHRVLCVPLRVQEEETPKYALLALQDVTEHELLTRHLKRQADFIEQLVRLSQAMLEGRLRMATVLQRILQTVEEMVEAQGGTLILVDQDYTPYALFTGGNLFPPTEFTHRALREGLAGWVLRHRKSERIEDTKLDERWLPGGYQDWRSVLSVPIFYGDTPLAVLTLSHMEPKHFTQEHQEMLEAAAEIIALALYTARLYEEHYYLTQQLAMARDETENLRRRQERFFRLLNQALQPSVEFIRQEWERLHEYYLQKSETIPEPLARLWETWQELERLLLMLETYHEEQREELHLSSFPLSTVLERVKRLLHPLMQQHSGTVKIELRPPNLILDSDEHKLFHLLFNLLYWALDTIRHGTVRVRIAPQGAHWVVLEMSLPGQPLDEESQMYLRRLAAGEEGKDPLMASRLRDPKLNLVAGLVRQLHGHIYLETRPRSTLLRLSLPRSLETRVPGTGSLRAQDTFK